MSSIKKTSVIAGSLFSLLIFCGFLYFNGTFQRNSSNLDSKAVSEAESSELVEESPPLPVLNKVQLNTLNYISYLFENATFEKSKYVEFFDKMHHHSDFTVREEYSDKSFKLQLTDGSKVRATVYAPRSEKRFEVYIPFFEPYARIGISGLNKAQCLNLVDKYKTNPDYYVVATYMPLSSRSVNKDPNCEYIETQAVDGEVYLAKARNIHRFDEYVEGVTWASITLKNYSVNSKKTESSVAHTIKANPTMKDFYEAGTAVIVDPSLTKAALGPVSYKACKEFVYDIPDSVKFSVDGGECTSKNLNIIRFDMAK